MDTRKATKQIKAQHWATVIKDRIDSGLSVTAYCEAHNISKTQYYYWLRAIREHCIETQMPQLVELQPPAVVPTTDKAAVADNFETEMVIKIGNANLALIAPRLLCLLKKSWRCSQMLRDATGFKHIYICTGFTDLRRGIDGLATYNGLAPSKKPNLFLNSSLDGSWMAFKLNRKNLYQR